MKARNSSNVRLGSAMIALVLGSALALAACGSNDTTTTTPTGGAGGKGSTGGAAGSSSGGGDDKSVTFSSGKASGALNGWGWIALGKLDTATDPQCKDDKTSDPRNITQEKACPVTGQSIWSSTDALCISGTIPVVTGGDYKSNWGLQIGVNTAEKPPTKDNPEGTLGQNFKKINFIYDSAGIKPKNTAIRGEIHVLGQSEEITYCLTVVSDHAYDLTKFNTACWDQSGDSLQESDIPNIDKIGIQISSDTNNEYKIDNFCWKGLSFE